MRYWDPQGEYKSGKIKDFPFWTMELSYRQHTLGSYILFCHRPIEKITELTSKELLGLQTALREIENIYANISFLIPDRWNYLQLGNAVHTLHIHAIPRYKVLRLFMGKTWIDSHFGKPVLWQMTEYPEEMIVELRQKMLHFFE